MNKFKDLVALLSVAFVLMGCEATGSKSSSRPSSSPAPMMDIVNVLDSELDSAPKVLKQVNPAYDFSAFKEGLEGEVVLRLYVGADGVPTKAFVVKGVSPKLDQSAINAVMQSRFGPAYKNGVKVAWTTETSITFKRG